MDPSAPTPPLSSLSVPIAAAQPIAFSISVTAKGCVDVFIDGIIKVMLDEGDNVQHHVHSVPLATHVCLRPHAGDDTEPIKRRDLLSL